MSHSSLFATHTTLPAIIEAVLEGRQGTLATDGSATRLSLGVYAVLGGDAKSDGARRLIAGTREPELIYGNDPAWRAAILAVRGAELIDRPMTEFNAGRLDPVHLASIAASVPPGFALRPIDLGLAAQLDHELEPQLVNGER